MPSLLRSLIEQQSESCTMPGREDEAMKRAKFIALAVAFASVTFASEAFARDGIIIYLGQTPFGYCRHPYFGYGYYRRYAYGPYRRGYWRRYPLK